jgi:hypothetical protein
MIAVPRQIDGTPLIITPRIGALPRVWCSREILCNTSLQMGVWNRRLEGLWG